MTQSRREFIKFVVAGSIAAGCPVDESLLAAPDTSLGDLPRRVGPTPNVHGEHFDVCHRIRDGFQYRRPGATLRADVVIVGGGVAGLSAAYFLRKYDFLLLEKDGHFGGNAYQQEYDGQAYATGSAFAYKGDYGDQLSRELGMTLLPVDNFDSTIVNGAWVPDTWHKGLDLLPYPQGVRDSFRKFRDALLKIDLENRAGELDDEPFSKYTAGYAPEIQQWWDAYGPSNWGAATAETSAYVGVETVQDIAGDAPDPRVILPGGLGRITHRLVEVLQPRYKDRLLADSTVVAVVPDEKEARVTYLRDGKLSTVAAKAVLFCAPKLIASRVVAGIPYEQKLAMRRIRYAPYPVVNLIFDKPVYSRAYDTWCPGNAFTDFIVADWTVRNLPGYRPKHNILTCYAPLPVSQRYILLEEENCKSLAARVLAGFQSLLPDLKADPVEVRIYRRGHPMYMATPGTYSRTIPAARVPMKRIFFGNADSGGPESLTSEAIRISRAGAEWVEKLLAGRPLAREFAEKALAG